MKQFVEDMSGPIIAIYGEPGGNPRWLREIRYIETQGLKGDYYILPPTLGLKYSKYIEQVKKKQKIKL